MTIARQRFGKHRLKAGIAAEVEVCLLNTASVNTFLRLRSWQITGGTILDGDLYSGCLEVMKEL
jgi:hypothetical protein